MADPGSVRLISPEDVTWPRVKVIQVKRYSVRRRMQLHEKGPLKSLPLLGSIRRFAVEVVHMDDTWDRVYWLEDPVEAHRLANELAAAHWLSVQVVL